MTLEGLYRWAQILLDKCRERGVNVVAVTDHHDLVSAFITLEVAMTKGYSDVWVFPGLEITSESGIQAIILLNPSIAKGDGSYAAAATEGLQNRVLTALGQSIMATQNPLAALQAPSWTELQSLKNIPLQEREEKFKTPRVERLNKSLDDIAQSMEQHFRDQYVILPNLEKNKQGILGNESGRSLYIDACAWFVGGIIGGPNETDESIIKGKNKDYGGRIVACLRSSDQRGDDDDVICKYFGQTDHTSWLKLSESSTISVNQALISGIGRRVFDKKPSIPSVYITSVIISGTDIFSKEQLLFKLSPSLNALIGGRGTGKSLVLSALMRVFGKDKEWIEKSKDNPETLSAWEKRHLSLFQDSGPFSDPKVAIKVEYILEPSVRYRLTLNSPGFSGSPVWSLDTHNGKDWEKISEYDCFPGSIDIKPMFFLQGQMSALTGEYQDDLTRLIEGPVRNIRVALRSELDALADDVQEGADKAIRLNHLKHEDTTLAGQIKQKSTEQEAFQKVAQVGLNEKEKSLFEAVNPLDRGALAASEIIKSVKSLIEELQLGRDRLQKDLHHEFEKLESLKLLDISKFYDGDGFSNDPYLNSLVATYENIIAQISDVVNYGNESLLNIQNDESQFDNKINFLKERAKGIADREQHRSDAKKKADDLGQEIAILQGKHKEVMKEINAIESSGVTTKGDEALKKYKERVQEYSKQLIKRSNEISNDDTINLYVQIKPGGRFSGVMERLKEIVYGAKVPEKTWNEMKDILDCDKEPANIISQLISSAISALKTGGNTMIPDIWKKCGFSEKIFQNIMGLTSIENWSKLSVVLADDHVEVKYKRRGQKPIPILHASPGERAVELLRLSLQTTDGPIIIDQPEDDLDNNFLAHNLVELVHHAKGRNQLLFASHSANLVVHGDSDLIYVMGTTEDDTGKGKCDQVACGTIDQPEICSKIEAIMEGGRKAFENRRRKYYETIDR